MIKGWLIALALLIAPAARADFLPPPSPLVLAASGQGCGNLPVINICPNAITFGNLVQLPTFTIVANATGSLANAQAVPVGPGLTFQTILVGGITPTLELTTDPTQPLAQSTTFANLPAASGATGAVYRVTDVGPGAGSLWTSNGSEWKPMGPVLLCEFTATQSVTNTTAETLFTGYTCPIPANLMGLTNVLQVQAMGGNSGGNTNSKKISAKFSVAFATAASTTSGNQGNSINAILAEAGAVSSQVAYQASTGVNNGPSAIGTQTSAVNTTVSQSVTFTGTLAVSTDTITINYARVMIAP